MDDFFRRLMGHPPRSGDRNNHVNDHPSNFVGTDNGDFESDINEAEQNFKMFSGIFQFFPPPPPTQYGNDQNLYNNPRDALLKDPSTNNEDDDVTNPPLQHHHRSNTPSPFVPTDYHDEMNLFRGFFGSMTPFTMMDEMMRGFSGITINSDFQDSPSPFNVPQIEGDFNTEDHINNRKILLKKDDDLDDRDSLPHNGPGYSYSPSTSDPSTVQPSIRRSFHSSSFVRIVKSDGSIKETKKYTDSSGREEVTVTHIDPNEEEHRNINSDFRDYIKTGLPGIDPNSPNVNQNCTIC